ncbi:MAG: hypothetical protein WBN92_10140 [Terriglobia bacterium]
MAKGIDLNIILGGRGGNWAYFVKNQKLIGEFIRVNQIKPSTIGPAPAVGARSAKAFIDLGIRGGIRVAHLHFNDKIYLLDAEQWAKFSGNIIANSRAKLERVKEVSFEEGMALGSVTQTLT